ncbi:MAG TPA: DUF1549 and DUF1553 domain-containing protein, partial [Gemmataceae bacterium]|nr:DUF1549 and DUF1553 domain-containing protein [Gemmataceae bacterium]
MEIAHRLEVKIPFALACLLLVAGTVEAGEKADSKSWAFRTPVRPPLPAVRNNGWVRNPIDAFVLAKLEEAGLSPAPEADRVKLIRRLSFDLIGLPPSPRDVDAFVRDSSADAYEKLVDRLLASPQYGERWTLFWLDLARFAESDGFKADDARPTAWRYRDYVIRSLNGDKPYDRFVREQLAGDELWPDDADALIATGFNRHYPYEFNAVNLEQRRQETLNDITDTTTQAFLGLTVGCARCHDHKFDPILQEDYYRVQAFFAAFSPWDRPVGSRDEIERYQRQLREWETRTAEVRKRMSELEKPYRQNFAATRKARFPKEYQAAYDMPAEKRSPLQQQLAVLVARQVETGADEVVPTMKPEVRKEWQGLARQMAESTPPKPNAPLAMVFTDIGAVAPPTFLLRRGEWRHRDREVAPGFLSAIDDKLAAIPGPKPGAKTAGRRSVLAEWLTRPDQPLTPRVMVNRLWQHHFGRGIVATPNDFGSQGDPPSHPELLDWLAREFVARGWSLKAMHRLMVTSATYRQSSGSAERRASGSAERRASGSAERRAQSAKPGPALRALRSALPAEIDPENRLLWRMNRRRLEGETLRDAMLAVSGRLNFKAG